MPNKCYNIFKCYRYFIPKVEILKTKETEFQRELIAGLQTNILCIGKITSGHRGRHTLFLKQPSHKHLL